MSQVTSIGRVSGIRIDGGETFVDVEMGPTRYEPDVRLASLAPGMHIPPKEGDLVELYETDQGLKARFRHDSREQDFETPELEDDSFIFRFNDETEIFFSNDGEGNYTVKLRGNESVLVESQGKVTIDGETIDLGDGSEGVVTDIETSTNSDGAVTSVTPIYSDKVNIE